VCESEAVYGRRRGDDAGRRRFFRKTSHSPSPGGRPSEHAPGEGTSSSAKETPSAWAFVGRRRAWPNSRWKLDLIKVGEEDFSKIVEKRREEGVREKRD